MSVHRFAFAAEQVQIWDWNGSGTFWLAVHSRTLASHEPKLCPSSTKRQRYPQMEQAFSDDARTSATSSSAGVRRWCFAFSVSRRGPGARPWGPDPLSSSSDDDEDRPAPRPAASRAGVESGYISELDDMVKERLTGGGGCRSRWDGERRVARHGKTDDRCSRHEWIVEMTVDAAPNQQSSQCV